MSPLPYNVLEAIEDAAISGDESIWDPRVSNYNQAERGWLALGVCLREEMQTTRYDEVTFDGKREAMQPPAWPSTLGYIEENVGGWRGLTSFSGVKGCGKTMLAIACAIEAAASGGWQVVYFLAEDDAEGLQERINNYEAAHDHAMNAAGALNFVSVPHGITLDRIFEDVSASVDTTVDKPLLVCFDSINTIASFTRRNYLAALHDLGLWAMSARRVSRGSVSFQLVAETNQRGEIKGANLGFWSDLVLKMKKVQRKMDDDGIDHEQRGIVQLTLDKARRWPGEGPMGRYVRDFRRLRFLTKEEARAQMRLVDQPVDYPDTDSIL